MLWFRLTIAVTLLWIKFTFIQAKVLSTGANVNDFITKANLTTDAVIFSKTTCALCKATKSAFHDMSETLSSIKFTYEVIELDALEPNDGQLLLHELYEMTGRKTLPNVFVGGMPIGGNEEVQNMVSKGSLETMIRQLKAAFN